MQIQSGVYAAQMSEADHPQGASTQHQLALVFVSGVLNQDAALRTALQLLRRKYARVEHVIATAVRFLSRTPCCTPACLYFQWAPTCCVGNA